MVYTILKVLTSTVKKIILSSETVVLFYQTILYHNPDDRNVHLHTWAYFSKIHFNATIKHYPLVKSVTYIIGAQL